MDNPVLASFANLKLALIAVTGCDERQAELWTAEIAAKAGGMVDTRDASPNGRALLEFFSEETERLSRV